MDDKGVFGLGINIYQVAAKVAVKVAVKVVVKVDGDSKNDQSIFAIPLLGVDQTG